VRRAYDAARRRPKPDFATIYALYHPDHELISIASRVEGRSFVGAEGFREVLRAYDETWESWGIDVEQMRSVDAERVLIVGVARATGLRSGVGIEQRFGQLVTVRDHKVVRTEIFSSPEAALAAAGLEE
jgi:ketosteroid isomerase-like protein